MEESGQRRVALARTAIPPGSAPEAGDLARTDARRTAPGLFCNAPGLAAAAARACTVSRMRGVRLRAARSPWKRRRK